MQIQKVTKQKKVSLEYVVGCQLINHCFENNIWLIKNEFDTLLHIALNGYDGSTLSQIVEKGIYKSVQCVRNCRGKLCKHSLLLQPKKRMFILNPEIEIVISNVYFELKLLHVNT